MLLNTHFHLSPMMQWVQEHPAVVWTFVGASVAMFVGSLLLTPLIVVRIPADYFAHARRPPGPWAHRPTAVRGLLGVGKNALGAVFVIAGLPMLVLPGQGLLTLLIGFMLIDFPGKYGLEKWLIRRQWVQRPINWLRRRRGREPLRVMGE